MPNELQTKKDLAYAYQIIAMLNWDDHTYTHLSSRAEDKESFYIYPFGLRFEEVTEDVLLKVTLDGEIIEGNECQYNQTGYVIHGEIYKNRSDINSIFHLHTPSSVAVSAMQDGLLPLSQWALHFYKQIAYHKYNSLALDNEEHGHALVRDLGALKTMLMENHGMLTCGATIMEAMFRAYHLEKACQAQCLMNSSGAKLISIPEVICERAVEDLLSFEDNLGERDWKAWVRMVERKNFKNIV